MEEISDMEALPPANQMAMIRLISSSPEALKPSLANPFRSGF